MINLKDCILIDQIWYHLMISHEFMLFFSSWSTHDNCSHEAVTVYRDFFSLLDLQSWFQNISELTTTISLNEIGEMLMIGGPNARLIKVVKVPWTRWFKVKSSVSLEVYVLLLGTIFTLHLYNKKNWNLQSIQIDLFQAAMPTAHPELIASTPVSTTQERYQDLDWSNCGCWQIVVHDLQLPHHISALERYPIFI